MATTGTKVLLGMGCVVLLLLLACLATCASCIGGMFTHSANTSSAPPSFAAPHVAPGTLPEDSTFKRANSKDAMDFVVVAEALGNDLSALRARAWNFCDARRSTSGCLVLMWSKQSMIPRSARVSGRQAGALVAYFVRSADRAHDCLQLFRDGIEKEYAGDCGSSSVDIEAQVNAWEACKQRVLSQLRAPSTAEFVDDRAAHHVYREKLSGNAVQKAVSLEASWAFGFTHYIVQGEVDAQNAFGAKLRSPFECSVTQTKQDRWMVMKARIFNR
jgi:hypothetical protein